MLDRSLCSLVIIVGIEIKNNPTTLTSLTILTTIMIFTSLSPNTEADDIFLALKILISPWLWVKGRAVKELENTFKQWLGVKYVFAFSSGRTCLYVILSSLGLSKNDEVLLQAYTCVAVPNSIIWAGAKPVYVDCEETIFNMSVEDLKKKITPKSKALIIQHTFGRPTKIDQLMAAAKENNLFVIEDCAHSLGAEYQEKKVGTFGDASFFSFGRDKVISSVFCGLLTTNNRELAEKIEARQNSFEYPSRLWVMRQLLHPPVMALVKLTYNFFYLGKIFLEVLKRLSIISRAVEPTEKEGGRPPFVLKKMPNGLALLALYQFQKLDRFNAHRRKIAKLYDKELKQLDIILPQEKKDSFRIYLRYPIQVNNPKMILRAAKKEGIELGDWYSSPIAPQGVNYEKVFYKLGSCPVAEKLSGQSLNLPTHIQIKEKDALRIIKFFRSANVKTPDILI